MSERVAMIRLFILALAALCGEAGADSKTLPEGFGLAGSYPGDAGIVEAPGVLLAEGFEVETLQEVVKRWDSASDDGGRGLALSDDVPFRDARAGRRRLQVNRPPG